MMDSTKWHLSMHGKVLVIRNTGIITIESQLGGRRALLNAVHAYRPNAVMVDLSGAALVMAQAGWETMARPEFFDEHRVELPLAYVVPQTNYADGVDLCSKMAEHGLLRLVFNEFELELAFEWCAALAGEPEPGRLQAPMPAAPASPRKGAASIRPASPPAPPPGLRQGP